MVARPERVTAIKNWTEHSVDELPDMHSQNKYMEQYTKPSSRNDNFRYRNPNKALSMITQKEDRELSVIDIHIEATSERNGSDLLETLNLT